MTLFPDPIQIDGLSGSLTSDSCERVWAAETLSLTARVALWATSCAKHDAQWGCCGYQGKQNRPFDVHLKAKRGKHLQLLIQTTPEQVIYIRHIQLNKPRHMF